MNGKFINSIAPKLHDHFREKLDYIDMFIALDTGPEEWFRVEILKVIRSMGSVDILSTNQKWGEISGRPDFVFKFSNNEYLVELKVLPPDRNYKTSYQRFCAGKTNKADFDDLVNEDRDIVIYIHWGTVGDWDNTVCKLQDRYAVNCYKSVGLPLSEGNLTFGYWEGSIDT